MKQAGKDWKWFIRMHSTEVSRTTPQKKDGVGNSTPHLSRGYPHTRTILKRQNIKQINNRSTIT